MITILMDKRLLKALLVLQVASCFLVQKEIFIGDLIVRLMILGFVSFGYWYLFTMFHAYVEKTRKRGNTRERSFYWMKSNRTEYGVGTVIGLCVYTVLFFTYVINYFPWIISHLVRVTRLFALVILLVYLYVLFVYIRSKRKGGEKVFSSENMNTTGLITENLLFSMILFIY